jgi:hypothetical protein
MSAPRHDPFAQFLGVGFAAFVAKRDGLGSAVVLHAQSRNPPSAAMSECVGTSL